jgi:SNF family Na+-dependent transporter
MGRYGGRYAHGSLPGIFDAVVRRPWAKYAGVLGLFVPLVIFFYYTYVESWCLAYSVFSLLGSYAHIDKPEQMKAFLSAFQGLSKGASFNSVGVAYGFFLMTFVANVAVIYLGLARGIELLCKIAIPVLLLAGIVLLIRIVTLGTPDPNKIDMNVTHAYGFMWNPHFGVLKEPRVWLAAAGQIFFTLSVGLGAIMTYASYLRSRDDVALSSTTAAGMNELFEVIIGGSIVIPAAYLFLGPEGTLETARRGTFDLGFVTMPVIMNRIPFGEIFGFYWFFLLFLAGITSSISLLQPLVSFLEDEFGWDRHKAAIGIGVFCFILTHACIFGLGAGVLDECDFWGGQLAITVCALLEVWIYLRYMGIERGWRELHIGADVRWPAWLRYVFPLTAAYLTAIIGYWAVVEWVPWIMKPFGYLVTMGLPPRWERVPVQPAILWTRAGLLALLLVLAVLVRLAWRRRARHAGGVA